MKPSKKFTKKICLNIAIVTILLALFSLNVQATYTSTAFPIPDSGKTKCYDLGKEIPCPEPDEDFYGQDGNYLINPPSYTKMDEIGNDLPDDAEHWIMVRDNVTGLIWEVKTDDGSIHDKNNQYTWYDSNSNTNDGYTGTAGDGTDTEDFIVTLNAENFGGYSDWRLPSLQELSSIVMLNRYDPAIETNFFKNVMSLFYWSSTSYDKNSVSARGISFGNGNASYRKKSLPYYVRAVRGGLRRSFNPLIINGDGTITNVNTGLMWQRLAYDIQIEWQNALSYCENLSLAGYHDWRLPSQKETQSIINHYNTSPMNKTIFSDRIINTWTSTSFAQHFDYAWPNLYRSGKSESLIYVRAVRGGQNQLSNPLIISSPKQGSIWNIGDIAPIKWKTNSITGNVNILLSRYGGRDGTFETIAENIENDGSHLWTAAGESSVNCMVAIEPINALEKRSTLGLFTLKHDCFFFNIPDFTIEDTEQYQLSFTLIGPENEIPELSVTSSNLALIPNNNIHVDADALHITLTFFPIYANQCESTTITVEMKGQTCTASENFSITILPVNDPPLIQISPQTLYTPKNIPIKLFDYDASLIQISDEDAADQFIQITLCASNGLMDLSQTTDLLLISETFENSEIISFKGKIDTINQALEHLIFIPTNEYSGYARIEITTNDIGFSRI
jgi:hypothetical protein